MPTDTKTVVYRLNDLEVQEVSMVDKPANQRKFLMVKNADGQAEVDSAMADKAAQDTRLLTEMNPEVQKQLGDSLKSIGDRCLALSASVFAATAVDKAEAVVPESLAKEVAAIIVAASSIVEKAPPPFVPGKKKPEGEDAAEDEEKPTTPPAAADAEGKPAVPPAKKKPPFIADQAKTDALVEALTKVDDMGIGEDAMKMLAQAAAQQAINCASDAVWRKDFPEAAKYTKIAYSLLSKYGSAAIDAATKLELVLEDFKVEKAGRKMSAARWAEFDKSLRAMLALAEEIEPGYATALTKSASSATMSALVSLIERKDDEIRKLKGGARPDSNARAAGEEPVKKPAADGWPLDMNQDLIPDISF